MNRAEYQREYQRAWRARNPTYYRDYRRLERWKKHRRLCPGYGGYACMAWLHPYRFLCSWCRRTMQIISEGGHGYGG